jgi:mono/diheme cytochrome c family protein
MKDGQLFHIITFGQGNMPSYAAQVDRDDRWKVVRFVRGLGAQP